MEQPPSCGHGVQTEIQKLVGTPLCTPPRGVPRGSTTESQGMERALWGGEFSKWNCMLYKSSPFNWRPDTHTHTHTHKYSHYNCIRELPNALPCIHLLSARELPTHKSHSIFHIDHYILNIHTEVPNSTNILYHMKGLAVFQNKPFAFGDSRVNHLHCYWGKRMLTIV